MQREEIERRSKRPFSLLNVFRNLLFFHCPVLVGGDAQRLQDSGRDFDESNQQSKDNHVAHHCLVGLLRLLIGVHLLGKIIGSKFFHFLIDDVTYVSKMNLVPEGVRVLQGESWLNLLDNPNSQTKSFSLILQGLNSLKWQRMEATGHWPGCREKRD